MHPLHNYLATQLAEKLRSKKLVVWYDARREFASFVGEVRTGTDVGCDSRGFISLRAFPNQRPSGSLLD